MFAAQNVVTGSVRLVKLEAPWPMLVCHCAEFYYVSISTSISGTVFTIGLLVHQIGSYKSSYQ